MAELTQQLTVEQQLLVSAAADEISATSSIHQQAVVRMLAVASEHGLNAANILQDLSVEMKSATSNKLPFVVDDLNSGVPVTEALARTPNVIPDSAVMALDVARSRGLEKPLNRALLDTTNRRTSESSGTEDFQAINRVTMLGLKYFWILNVLAFLMLFIIPQFKMMFTEFGIELPASMRSLVVLSDFLAKFWFVFAFVCMVFAILFVWRNPRLVTNYFTRWIPNRWQQPMLSKRGERELSLAWVVQSSDGLSQNARQFVKDNGASIKEVGQASDSQQDKSGDEVLAVLAAKRLLSRRAAAITSEASSRESAAWILRKLSQQRHFNRRQRGLTGLRVFYWIANFCLMAMGAWTAVAIFQSLLSIIRGLT